MDKKSSLEFRALRRAIVESFSKDELQTLAYDLGVEWEDLPGEGITTKCHSLIGYMVRRKNMPSLYELLREERPKVDWPRLSDKDQDATGLQAIQPITQENYISRIRTFLANNLLDGSKENEQYAKQIEDLTWQVLWSTSVKDREEIIRFLYEMDLIRVPQAVLNLKKANLGHVDFDFYDLPNIALNNANLIKSKMNHTNLRESNLASANLSGADLHYANLSRADLREANLFHADLNNVDLIDADLQGANLSVANLENIDLSGANLKRADLSFTNLDGARLDRANLSKTDLTGVEPSHLSLDQATFDHLTEWPEDFDPIAAGAIFVEEESSSP